MCARVFIAFQIPGELASAASLLGIFYTLIAIFAVLRFRPTVARQHDFHPGVTVLKPVCGADPQLYDNLRSFCLQDYDGALQVIIGAHRESDPAVEVARRLIADLPDVDITLVVDGALPGSNFKVCNLLNMMAVAKHPLLVLADSDMRVEPHYLSTVVAPLEDERVGLVTCLYKATPAGDTRIERLCSQLGSAFINYNFLPSVLVGSMLGAHNGCFGATIALTRKTLDRIGGFGTLVHQIADDYMLGTQVRALGLEVVVARYIVENVVLEPDLGTLMGHELRWLRTIRTIAPLGLVCSVISHSLALALVALPLRGFSSGAWLLLAASLAARVALLYTCNYVHRPQRMASYLLPLRDLMSLGLLGAAFCGQRVTWRQQQFQLHSGGELTFEGDPLV